MDPTIIVAAIMAGGTIVAQLVIAYINKKTTTEIINYRVGELEKKVTAHNNLIERTYCIEKAIDVKDEQIKVINHRIADLEAKE